MSNFTENCHNCFELFYQQSLFPLQYVDLTFCGEKLTVIGCFVEPLANQPDFTNCPKICRTCLELLRTTFSDNGQTLTHSERDQPKKTATHMCATCSDYFPARVMMSLQLTVVNYEGHGVKLVDCYRTCKQETPEGGGSMVCLACVSAISDAYRKHQLEDIPLDGIKVEPIFTDEIQFEQSSMVTECPPASFPEVKIEPELLIEHEDAVLESHVKPNIKKKSIVKRRKRQKRSKKPSTKTGKFLRVAPDDKPELFKSLTDPYECSFCKERFRQRMALIEHLKKHRPEKWPEHEKTDRHQCPICNLVWNTKFRLKRHLINSHYKSSSYKCHHCPVFRTLTKATLEEHLLFRHFDIEQQCPDCPMVLPNRRSYLKHIKTHQLPNQLQCPGCKRCFAKPQQYRFHMKTNKTVIGCKQCDAAFHSVRSLDTHMQIVHDWVFTCKVCKMPFANRQNYNIHLRIQHSIHVKPSCKYCAKEFESTGEMMAHQKSEHEVRNYICETCGKNFNTPCTLKSHVRQRHQSDADEVEKAKCHICGKALRDEKSVARHIKLIHTKSVTRKTPKLVYTCPQCPQWKFARHQHLEGHMVIHNTENRRFFQCFNCGIAYTRRQKFDIHVKKCFGIRTDN